MMKHKIFYIHVKACVSCFLTDNKSIVAIKLTSLLVGQKMWDTVNFSEPEKRRPNFTSN